MADDYKGYKGITLEVLKKYEAMVWCDVVVTTAQTNFIGIILPRSETSDHLHIVLKLRSGYNVGILAEKV